MSNFQEANYIQNPELWNIIKHIKDESNTN